MLGDRPPPPQCRLSGDSDSIFLGTIPIAVSALSEKAQSYHEKVRQFINSKVIPLEKEFVQHAESNERWTIPDKIEELKVSYYLETFG